MNPELPRDPREELEARLTALLLGELSADEAAEVRAAIAKDPELAKLHARLEQTLGLVREVAASPSEPATAQAEQLRLSEERREKLLAHFKTIAPPEFAREKKRSRISLVEWAAVCAILIVIAGLAMPNFVKSRNTSQSNAVINNLRQIDSAKQQWALENNKHDSDTPTVEQIKPYLKGGSLPPSVAGESYSLGRVGDDVVVLADDKTRKKLGGVPRLNGSTSANALPPLASRSSGDLGGVPVDFSEYRGDAIQEKTRNLKLPRAEASTTSTVTVTPSATPDASSHALTLSGNVVDQLAKAGQNEEAYNRYTFSRNLGVADANSKEDGAGNLNLYYESRPATKRTEITLPSTDHEAKPWTADVSIRGFYDDNLNSSESAKTKGAGVTPTQPGDSDGASSFGLNVAGYAGKDLQTVVVGDKSGVAAGVPESPAGRPRTIAESAARAPDKGRIVLPPTEPAEVALGTAPQAQTGKWFDADIDRNRNYWGAGGRHPEWDNNAPAPQKPTIEFSTAAGEERGRGLNQPEGSFGGNRFVSRNTMALDGGVRELERLSEKPKSRQEALDAAVRRQAAIIERARTGQSATDFNIGQGIIADTPAATAAGGRSVASRGAEVANPVPATPPITDPNTGLPLPSVATDESVVAKADIKYWYGKDPAGLPPAPSRAPVAAGQPGGAGGGGGGGEGLVNTHLDLAKRAQGAGDFLAVQKELAGVLRADPDNPTARAMKAANDKALMESQALHPDPATIELVKEAKEAAKSPATAANQDGFFVTGTLRDDVGGAGNREKSAEQLKRSGGRTITDDFSGPLPATSDGLLTSGLRQTTPPPPTPGQATILAGVAAAAEAPPPAPPAVAVPEPVTAAGVPVDGLEDLSLRRRYADSGTKPTSQPKLSPSRPAEKKPSVVTALPAAVPSDPIVTAGGAANLPPSDPQPLALKGGAEPILGREAEVPSNPQPIAAPVTIPQPPPESTAYYRHDANFLEAPRGTVVNGTTPSSTQFGDAATTLSYSVAETGTNSVALGATAGGVPAVGDTFYRLKLNEAGKAEVAGKTTVEDLYALSDTNGHQAKAPVLGDLPLAGRLFRSEAQAQDTKSPEKRGFALLGPSDPSSLPVVKAEDERRLEESLGRQAKTGKESAAQTHEAWETAKVEQKTDVASLNKQIADSRKQVDELRQGLKISDYDASGAAPTLSLDADTVRRLQSESARYETLLADKKRQLSELDKRVPAAVSAKNLETEVELRKQIDQLQAASEVAKKNLEQASSVDLAKNEATHPYYEAKAKLEELENFKKIINMRRSAETIDVNVPRSALVEVIDRAEPAKEKNAGNFAKLGSFFATDYESTARLKVERDAPEIPGMSGQKQAGTYDPYFVKTEEEAIRSEAILGRVVDELALDKDWAKKSGGKDLKRSEAIAELRKKLDVEPVKDTSLLEIRAKSADPKEAARLANAVAEVYKKSRLEKGKALIRGGIEALNEQFAAQDIKIKEQQAVVDRLARELREKDKAAQTTPPPAVEVEPPPVRKVSTNSPIPQPEVQVSENAFSTFSLNVSDVSFKLAGASLEKGQMPDVATIRSEEFINAFDYRDPEAAPGTAITFAWERARYPFAHNRDLLRFSLKTAAVGRQAGRPLNIVLLLDNSGSMERADRVAIIREALHVLAKQLQPQDKLSVITFARTPRLWVDGVSGDKAGEVADQIGDLTPAGGTNLEDAMKLAYQTASRHYSVHGINRVVVLTDGAANLGNVDPDSLKQTVESQRKQGIALDCFGIGWEGFNDDLLEVLSRNGDGRYGFLNSPEEAASEFAQQLAGALQVAASDVKVQVEFNPRRATAYRQIGYAKHQLTKQQFRDNTVDAAEIASQEAGNALYTVEVNPAGEGPICTVRVRYKIPGTVDYREQEWDVPFNGNSVSLESASPAMRLAATASAFSEWLAASPFAGEVNPNQLLNYLSGVPEIYGADVRPKKLEWMIRQAKSIEGK